VESNYIAYDFLKSFDRIDDILSGSDTDYNDANSIPARSQLTFRNGFYVNCSALFVDIRKSSELAGKYKRPTLAKLYRAYVAVCRGQHSWRLCFWSVRYTGQSQY
jgi:class 3 adenylate cyclase